VRAEAILAYILVCLAGCKPSPKYVIPAQETSRANPVQLTPDSATAGGQAYEASGCALCHGKDGDGHGALARDVSMNTHDWRDPLAQKNYTDGDLFYIIAKGKGSMPGYETQMNSRQAWLMVDYIRSLARK
jgi:mono/diheme cytochrome c family protein